MQERKEGGALDLVQRNKAARPFSRYHHCGVDADEVLRDFKPIYFNRVREI